MSADFNIIAESRTDVGKGASRRLRHTGKVPGIIYGSGKDPVAFTVVHDDLMHHLENEAFYSHILTVTVDGKVQKAVLKDLQRHPAKPKILHVDFLRVSDKDVINMQVPMHFINEELSVGVKEGGLVSHLLSTIEITCKASDLPEYLQIDLTNLDVGASLHLSDIDLPKGVQITALTHGTDHDLPVVSIHAPKGGGTEEDEVADIAATEEGDTSE
ncbi:MAG: 50S ribosomal protein L25/general stress protein Ctc [Gammaproteobacteria bacterium]|nr:50S ribosomal protein L25/general stress protein Ctc [Gammaproteobacteria bacterium]MCF6259891.1 50S ribosomal protein L25/general stress protein Ctc [Gammaproteobacteria bacterium]